MNYLEARSRIYEFLSFVLLCYSSLHIGSIIFLKKATNAVRQKLIEILWVICSFFLWFLSRARSLNDIYHESLWFSRPERRKRTNRRREKETKIENPINFHWIAGSAVYTANGGTWYWMMRIMRNILHGQLVLICPKEPWVLPFKSTLNACASECFSICRQQISRQITSPIELDCQINKNKKTEKLLPNDAIGR